MTTVLTITFISKPVIKNKEAALIKINRPDDLPMYERVSFTAVTDSGT